MQKWSLNAFLPKFSPLFFLLSFFGRISAFREGYNFFTRIEYFSQSKSLLVWLLACKSIEAKTSKIYQLQIKI